MTESRHRIIELHEAALRAVFGGPDPPNGDPPPFEFPWWYEHLKIEPIDRLPHNIGMPHARGSIMYPSILPRGVQDWHTCARCHGKGEVPVSGWFGYLTVDYCPRCEGSGMVSWEQINRECFGAFGVPAHLLGEPSGGNLAQAIASLKAWVVR